MVLIKYFYSLNFPKNIIEEWNMHSLSVKRRYLLKYKCKLDT